MKKLLLILTIIALCATLFAGCGNNKKDETTTENVVEASTLQNKTDSSIEQGKLRGDTYVNKSLGFRVYVPTDYTRQDFGDLVLTPDSTDVPTYEYYIAETSPKDESKRKSVNITIEETKTTSTAEWAKNNSKSTETKNRKAEKSATIGIKEFSAVSETDSKKETTKVTFGYIDKGRIVQVTFENFKYDEAIDFISQYFETK